MKTSIFIFFFLLVIFFDSVAVGLTFTIVPPLLFNEGPSAFLTSEVTQAARGLFLSTVIICFTVGQFICSPLLGHLSTIKGHKKSLLLLFFLSVIAYSVGMAGLWMRSLLLLFAFKFLVGISSSGRPIFQAALVQQIPDKKKAKLFGWMGAIGGLGFMTGSSLTTYGIEAFPLVTRSIFLFGTAALLSLLNYLLIALTLKQLPTLSTQEGWRLQQGFSTLKSLMKQPPLKLIFSVVLFYFIAWELFYTFAPLLLMKQLRIPAEQMPHFYTYVTFWTLAGNTILEHWASRFSNRKVLLVFSPLWSLILLAVGFLTIRSIFWIAIGLISSLGAVLSCTFTAFLADQVETRYHVEGLSLLQALQCLARLLPSFALASSLIHYPSLPLAGGALAFLTMVYFMWHNLPRKEIKKTVY